MRFDLELDIPHVLSKESLDNAANIFYNNEYDISPIKWDTKTANFILNNGNINLNKFNNFKQIKNNIFSSGSIKNDTSLSINSVIKNNKVTNIVFNGGDFYSYRDIASWSINRIVSEVKFDNGYYKFKLDSDTDIDTIQVFTLKLNYPSYFKKLRDYKYVEYDNVSIDSTFNNGSDNYKFTIFEGVVYLNTTKIKYVKKFIGKSKEKNNVFALPEFPAININIENFNNNEYIIKSGAVLFKNNNNTKIEEGEDIIVTYEVTPIISFKQKTRSETRPDIVYENTNMSPKSIGFTSGALCLYSSYNNEIFPVKLELDIRSNSNTISFTDSLKVTPKLLGVDNIPINNIPLEGKNIKLKVLSNNAIWQETNTDEYDIVTGLSGEAYATLNSGSKKVGVFIQKDWIKNIDGEGIITIPYRLPIIGDHGDINLFKNNIYVYLILDKDPILGKRYATNGELGVREFYSDQSLMSYEINGRKVAYVGLKNIEDKIYSRFIKPKSITIENTDIVYKNLFVLNKNEGLDNFNKDSFHYQINLNGELIASDQTVIESGKYEQGILPFDRLEQLKLYEVESTVLKFESHIPITDDLLGAFIVTDRIVEIQAEYDDGLINLTSDKKTITIKSMESEDAFLISGEKITGKITSLNDLGYYSITEYIKNPFGLTGCSYYCIYSDSINKQCIHKNIVYRKYFKLDEEQIGCIHTPEYDSLIQEEDRCPGVYAKIINPFIMTTDIEE